MGTAGQVPANAIYITDDDDLKSELSNILYGIAFDRRCKQEPEVDTKNRLNGRSPDRFDAMMMSYVSPAQGGGAALTSKHSLWS